MKSGAESGHYEIGTLLGKRGMGEVWRGRDTRLGRALAFKTPPMGSLRSACFRFRPSLSAEDLLPLDALAQRH